MTAQAANAQKATTKDRLLAEAARCFADNGFHGTSMTDIERGVGIKRGALYYHISSKEELLYEVSVRHVHEAIATAESIVASIADPVEQLREIARKHVELVGNRRVECIVWLRESHALSGAYGERVNELRADYEELVAATFRRAVRRRQLRNITPVVIKGFIGLIGFSVLWVDPDGPKSAEAIADELVDMALYGALTDAARAQKPRPRRRRAAKPTNDADR
ncbi:TetR/AcrR family transcriptional regulator [Cumulibacter soli]|uniref:TetR/AcrR family transcriptional regulator n=1 Tax=Cumulibacter soli TaxID=2546344 RepID=UPI001067DB68|nr:TetR/AcrR family transcriptional regulator [Cumulibacter soli]